MAKTGKLNAKIRTRFKDAMADIKSDQLAKAHGKLSALVKDHPKTDAAWVQLSQLEMTIGRPLLAAKSIEMASRLAPEDADISMKMATVALSIKQPKVAVQIYATLCNKAPSNPNYPVKLAEALNISGETDQAVHVLEKAHRDTPHHPGIYALLFKMRDVQSLNDPYFIAAKRLWDQKDGIDRDAVILGFALAKALEDLGELDDMMDVLHQVNAYNAKTDVFDPVAYSAAMRNHLSCFPEKTEVQRFGSSQFCPVFLVGLPRTGTTLMEQILSRHPQAETGGEIPASGWLFGRYFVTADGLVHPQNAGAAKMDDFANQYTASAMESAQSNLAKIVDKAMRLEFYIGWLAAAFPKAKFVVVRRDPRDMALSMYKNHFAIGTHPYTSDFAHIAHVHNTFQQGIRHWRDIVDVVEVSYDDLVSNSKSNARQLVEAAGLPWDDACLQHDKKASAIRTLSVNQARKPIYSGSSGGWQAFEAHLSPFIEACEELN